jgi:hypothetical protein
MAVMVPIAPVISVSMLIVVTRFTHFPVSIFLRESQVMEYLH